MDDNYQITNAKCRACGCDQAQAMDDARILGLEEEFASGVFTCCQVVAWADEQWLAWSVAAEQDGKVATDATRPLEISEPAREFVYVRARKPRAN